MCFYKLRNKYQFTDMNFGFSYATWGKLFA